MKRSLYLAVLAVTAMLSVSCEKADFRINYEKVTVASNELEGVFAFNGNTARCFFDDGELVDMTLVGGPGWPGSVTWYYDMSGGKAVRYTVMRSFANNGKEDLVIVLKEESAGSYINYDKKSRKVETNFYTLEDKDLTLYSASSEKFELLGTTDLQDDEGRPLYMHYIFTAVHDNAVLDMLTDNIPDTEENWTYAREACIKFGEENFVAPDYGF